MIDLIFTVILAVLGGLIVVAFVLTFPWSIVGLVLVVLHQMMKDFSDSAKGEQK